MRHLTRLPHAAGDVALLIGRLLLGAVLIAHGWQKVTDLEGTQKMFDGVGVPLPDAVAVFAAAVELGGGIALLLGAFTALASLLVIVVMAGAAAFVHLEKGLFAKDGGWELVGVIAVACLFLMAHGAGQLSVDGLLRRGAPATAHDAAREPVRV